MRSMLKSVLLPSKPMATPQTPKKPFQVESHNRALSTKKNRNTMILQNGFFLKKNSKKTMPYCSFHQSTSDDLPQIGMVFFFLNFSKHERCRGIEDSGARNAPR